MIAIRPYLDMRQTPAGHPAPLKFSICIRRDVAYFSTGIRITADEWDAVALRSKNPAVQHRIDVLRIDIDTLILDMQKKRKLDGLSARCVRDIIARNLTPDTTAPVRFLDAMRRFAASRPQQRTRDIYAATIAKVEQFDPHAPSLDFQDITVGWLDRFDSFLAGTSPKRNARNIHLRNIRAAFNHALKSEWTLYYPFRKYEIRPEPTAKRSLTADQLRTLFNADVPDFQKRYIDFFAMSFLLVGINTEDLLHATGIGKDGRLDYQRAKTHRPYSIFVEPECADIIKKYPGRDFMLDVLDRYACTHHWTSRVDRSLKAIAADLGLPPISMYWARHSWATIAADLDIPKETIAAALGHSSNTVTDIYINFDRAKIDRANRQVIDFVLYGKRPATVQDLLQRNFDALRKQLAGNG